MEFHGAVSKKRDSSWASLCSFALKACNMAKNVKVQTALVTFFHSLLHTQYPAYLAPSRQHIVYAFHLYICMKFLLESN